jgi:hypothetical protein
MNQGRLQRFARGKTYNLSEIYAANEASKEPYLTALVELIGKLEDNHKAYYAGMGWQRDYEQKRGVTFGDKWDKVWVMTEYGNAEKEYKKARIVCHIDSNTGIIYKSNSWQGAPYPQPRADIYQPESYEYADPHGGWLYANFKADQPSTQTQKSKGTHVKEILEKGEAIMSGK